MRAALAIVGGRTLVHSQHKAPSLRTPESILSAKREAAYVEDRGMFTDILFRLGPTHDSSGNKPAPMSCDSQAAEQEIILV